MILSSLRDNSLVYPLPVAERWRPSAPCGEFKIRYPPQKIKEKRPSRSSHTWCADRIPFLPGGRFKNVNSGHSEARMSEPESWRSRSELTPIVDPPDAA
jgi:hypothetical protein